MCMGEFTLEMINEYLLELVNALCKKSSQLRYRKNGFFILEAIMKTKDLEAWETEMSYKNLVYQMVEDPNWRIRRQFCAFTIRFFAPLKEFETIQCGSLSPLQEARISPGDKMLA